MPRRIHIMAHPLPVQKFNGALTDPPLSLLFLLTFSDTALLKRLPRLVQRFALIDMGEPPPHLS